MARGLYVGVFADPRQLEKGLAAASTATKTFSREMAVSSETLARTRVAGSVKTTEALKLEVAEYHRLAAAAEKGSAEQVAAANLATQAERRLAASMGVAAHEANTLARSSSHAERELSRAVRGALSGSGIFRGFGRSLAFASGGFLAFRGVSEFLRGSVDAALEAVKAQKSLAAQMKASGESFTANRERIDRVSLSYGKFGFQNDEVIQSLTVLERGTGNINRAIRLQGLTADIARAKNIDLAAAANVLAKVFGGQETALRRAVPGLSKTAHGMDLIRLAQAKLAGQAAANTTVGERFAATLHNTEEIIGTALLPTLNRYLSRLSVWLDRTNRSGQLQKDVADAVTVLKQAMSLASTAVAGASEGLKTLNRITGSTKRSLELLLGAFLAFKGVKLASTLATIASNLGLIGASAATSTGKVKLLRGALVGLRALGPIAATVVVYEILKRAGVVPPLQESVAPDATVKIGGRTYIRGSIAELEARQAQRLRRLGFPAGLGAAGTAGGNLFAPGATAGGAPAGGGGQATAAGVAALTAAQLRRIALAGDPSLAVLRATQAYDRRALAFLEQRRQAGKISAKNYVDQYVALTDDLAQQTSAINSILADQARKARDAAARRKAAAKKAADAAKKALTATADSVSAFAQTLEPGFSATLKAADAARKVAAKAIADAAARAKQFTVPLGLQLAQARAAATPGGADDLAVQRRIKQAALRALKSGRLAIQGQIDAWNAIASANDALNASLSSFGPTGRVASAEALTSGIRFASVAARRRQEARIAQALAHGGHLPGGISVQGQPIEVHTHIELDGREVARTVTRHQQQQVRHRAIQTSGPHAGRALQ